MIWRLLRSIGKRQGQLAEDDVRSIRSALAGVEGYNSGHLLRDIKDAITRGEELLRRVRCALQK